MKTLSIQQPWAWAIVNLGKVENRSWPTKYRGPLLVHAGKRLQRGEFQARADFLDTAFVHIQRSRDWPVGLATGRVPPPERLGFGGVVGRVRLVDCVWMPEDLPRGSEGFNPWHDPGSFGFYFADWEPLPFRPTPGKLGLFELPEGLSDHI